MAPQDPLASLFDALLPSGPGAEHRTKLQHSADQLGSEEIDPPYITMMESFEGWQHAEMYAKTQEMDPSVIGDLAQACHAIVGSLPIGFGFALIKSTITEKWEGAAADAALAATETLAGASDKLTAGVQAIGVKLDILSSAAQDVKNSIPAPTSDQPLSLLPLTPTVAATQEEAREAAREEAVRKLQNIYVPNYQDVGTNVPVLPAPHSPSGAAADGARILGVDGAGSPGATDRSVLNGDGGFTSGTGDSPAIGDAATDGQHNANDPAATSAASAEGAGQGGGTGSGSAGTAAPTTAANSQNAGAAGSGVGGSANSGGVGGYGGGSRSGSSGPGSGGSGAGGSNTRKRNDKRDNESQGSSVVSGSPIPPGGAAAGAGAAAAAATATPVKPSMSRPGMGMGPGMMGAPGRVGGNGDGDTEHQTPSYLINVDNGNELIGKLDPVAPPVIGA
ncbi:MULTISPECIES: hypothetical protein [Rhodococcus]|nr:MULTISPECIES: hypothetical protein [Rhodococcus]MDV7241335.1 hypothetical protein [Rhodococcus oxybenzonivorans]MDV7274132.1 hypothetical protein [Rhodococcus oxybenzonivorans]MDV7333615.1 hypothetical protein [Rhodococcus oxybenzonivorans]MDV7343035.1 hypothetical protein [Rhodococcus oxybenzonivorans]MDV8028185.1 hypothetical protein [Rhodococcus sp. IEGM 27]